MMPEATRGQVLYRLRHYSDAVLAFERMAARPVWADRYHAACLAQLGRHAEARAKAAEVLRRQPCLTLRRYAVVEPFMLQADIDHLIDGMRKAELPN
jgi:adenylate cyclase